MADIVSSLFGVTPELYQQQQAAEEDKRALALAQLSPFQRAEFNISRGGYNLGQAVGGAMGAQDPQLQLISARNAIARQINYNDPASIQQGVQQLAQAGDTVGAMQLATVGRDLEYKQAQTKQALAAAGRERQQGIPADVLKAQRIGDITTALQSPDLDPAARANLEAQLKALQPEKTAALAPALQLAGDIEATQSTIDQLTSQPESPERNAALKRAQTRLAALERQLPREAAANVHAIGVAEGTRRPVFIDANTDQQFVYDTDATGKQVRKPYVGGVDRTTAKISTTSQNIQENEFSKQLGSAQAKRYETAVGLRDAARTAIGTLETLANLTDQGLISGSFATGRVGASNLLNTLGLVSGADADRLARSENYQKIAGDVVLSTIGGKLGGGISGPDLKFIQSLVPQLETSATARRQLIDFMLKKNRDVLTESNNLINFAENKRTLNNYTPVMSLPSLSGGSTGLSGLSDEELRRRYEAAKGKK